MVSDTVTLVCTHRYCKCTPIFEFRLTPSSHVQYLLPSGANSFNHILCCTTTRNGHLNPPETVKLMHFHRDFIGAVLSLMYKSGWTLQPDQTRSRFYSSNSSKTTPYYSRVKVPSDSIISQEMRIPFSLWLGAS